MRVFKIFVVSDGTGRTAEQALKAALTQFGGVEIDISKYPGVRSGNDVRRVVGEAAAVNAFIIHTLVTDELRAEMVRAGRRLNVEMIDLIGALLARLSERFHISPAEKPGLYNQLNKYYFRRIETMEFAINHDDGLRIHEIGNAEIVLLGVSRTFKTPLSVYLANKGWFVANIPVVFDHELPREVHRAPPENVFCLDTNALRLAELRKARDEYLRGKVGEYAKTGYVRRELAWARRIYSRHPGWRRIDVTNKPIEEIASEIVSLKGAYNDVEAQPE
jgi:regulator of PEP synthase PpsR (kinase-PPPase family)